MRVIGAGFGRTGTLSLKHALERLLGGRCYHDLELMANPADAVLWLAAVRAPLQHLPTVLSGYVASVDWPGAYFWRDMGRLWPDATVVLSYREPDAWLRSFKATILRLHSERESTDDNMNQVFLELVTNGAFEGDTSDEGLLRAYTEHRDMVMDTVPSGQLVLHRPELGWEPLCKALDVPVPDVPYPNLNDVNVFNFLFSDEGVDERTAYEFLKSAIGGDRVTTTALMGTLRRLGWLRLRAPQTAAGAV